MCSPGSAVTTRNRGTECVKSPEMLLVANAARKTRDTYDRRRREGAGAAPHPIADFVPASPFQLMPDVLFDMQLGSMTVSRRASSNRVVCLGVTCEATENARNDQDTFHVKYNCLRFSNERWSRRHAVVIW